uniref:hypothetical protein n=1 Tax=Klebsiella quasipneumoniae TaxID=1463165 RepID=UPI0021D5931C|nr:hypothetical protein [Klebsiella quasipneumoniae]
MTGYQEAAGAPGAGLRTRGCFVTPGDHKATGLLEAKQLTKMSGNVTGYQEAAGAPGAGLRTRGLFCHTGRSQSYRAT